MTATGIPGKYGNRVSSTGSDQGTGARSAAALFGSARRPISPSRGNNNGRTPEGARPSWVVLDYTEKYSSYSNGCGRCAAGMISAVRL